MPVTFETPAELADWLPDAPAYVEGDEAWLSLGNARRCVSLSETGFDKLRQRLNRKYEHRDARGRVWIYGPYWLRLWAVDKH
jgi:hypothetical protein